MKITFLGTGANGGTPQIDCNCKNCQKARNTKSLRRLRSSVLIEHGPLNLLIDCTPDIRVQLERVGLLAQQLSVILITHCHFDHIGGLPEIAVGALHRVQVLCPNSIQDYLTDNFYFNYIFNSGYGEFTNGKSIPLDIRFIKVPHTKLFDTFGITIKYGSMVLGYFPDISAIEPSLGPVLSQCDTIIFDGTFIDHSRLGHISIVDSVRFLPADKRVYFTHINHSESANKLVQLSKQFGFHLPNDFDTINLNY